MKTKQRNILVALITQEMSETSLKIKMIKGLGLTTSDQDDQIQCLKTELKDLEEVLEDIFTERII